MATRKELLEQYEDAQFSLLMDVIMEREGKELEEQKRILKQDPAAAVPFEVRARSMETIRVEYEKWEKQKKARRFKTTLRTLLIAAVVATLLLSSVSADFRLTAKNFVYELTELAAELMFDFGDDTGRGNTGEVIMGYYIPALPDEFELVDAGEQSDGKYVWRQYKNNDGFVMINISNDDGTGFTYGTDVENTEAYCEIINQFNVLVIEGENRIQFVLSDKDHQKHIEITSTAHSYEELKEFISAIKN